MSFGKELYDAVEYGDEQVVEELLKKATAKDVNWIGEVSLAIYTIYEQAPHAIFKMPKHSILRPCRYHGFLLQIEGRAGTYESVRRGTY